MMHIVLAIVGVAAALLTSAAQTPASGPPAQQTPMRPSVGLPIPPGSYAGTQACQSCHRDRYNTYVGTAHHLTSRPADKSSVLGSFAPPANMMRTANPALSFEMTADRDGFYQTAITGREPHVTRRTERFDIVTGSGRKGQTYLYWRGAALFQLPVSYWVGPQQWTNSPGYADGIANFDRPIVGRCLDCHATSFEHSRQSVSSYNTSNYMLGIACEKCHAPGKEHIARYSSRSAGTGPAIVNPKTLPRDRQIDLCATCHAGGAGERTVSFSFRPGDRFDDYYMMMPGQSVGPPDVHGNQVGLLKNSRCFRSDERMTCSTCHDVHRSQRDTVALSDKCLTCHTPAACRVAPKPARGIAGRCVDCHMPVQQSQMIASTYNGTTIREPVRTHLIKVYPEQTQAVLKALGAR
jgi:hypothetical protein